MFLYYNYIIINKSNIMNLLVKLAEKQLSIDITKNNAHELNDISSIGQALILRIEEMKKNLNSKFYTFTHGVEIEMAAFHDLLTALRNNDVSLAFDKSFGIKYLRAPGVAKEFTNISDFFQKKEKNTINDHVDSNSLISCDGYHHNSLSNESALHFCEKGQRFPLTSTRPFFRSI